MALHLATRHGQEISIFQVSENELPNDRTALEIPDLKPIQKTKYEFVLMGIIGSDNIQSE